MLEAAKIDLSRSGSGPGSGLKPVLSGILWALSSTALLTLGFLAWVYISFRLATSGADEASIQSTRTALGVYARLVLLKGLLPQLLLALLAWPVLDRLFSLRDRGRKSVAAGLLACAALAAAVVIPTLLTSSLLDLPAVKFKDAWNFVQTYLEMTIGVSAALLLPRLLRRPPS